MQFRYFPVPPQFLWEILYLYTVLPLNTKKKVAMAQALYEDKKNSIDDICQTLNISRSTLYRYIKTAATGDHLPRYHRQPIVKSEQHYNQALPKIVL